MSYLFVGAWIAGVILSLTIFLWKVVPFVEKHSKGDCNKKGTTFALRFTVILMSFLFSYVNIFCLLALGVIFWGNKWEMETKEDRVKYAN